MVLKTPLGLSQVNSVPSPSYKEVSWAQERIVSSVQVRRELLRALLIFKGVYEVAEYTSS